MISLQLVCKGILIVTFYYFCSHFQLPVYYCISIESIKNGVDGEIIFVNIYGHCEILKMRLLYIYKINIII